jgi:hypothetical protein
VPWVRQRQLGQARQVQHVQHTQGAPVTTRTLPPVRSDILQHAAAAAIAVMRAHTAAVACHQPGTVDTNREGVGGGFRELDEEEAAEARRRREQFENDDTGMCARKPLVVARLRACREACMQSCSPHHCRPPGSRLFSQRCRVRCTNCCKACSQHATPCHDTNVEREHCRVTLQLPLNTLAEHWLWRMYRYDDFGRLKKKFRAGADDRKAREAAALARLHGLVSIGCRHTSALCAADIGTWAQKSTWALPACHAP